MGMVEKNPDIEHWLDLVQNHEAESQGDHSEIEERVASEVKQDQKGPPTRLLLTEIAQTIDDNPNTLRILMGQGHKRGLWQLGLLSSNSFVSCAVTFYILWYQKLMIPPIDGLTLANATLEFNNENHLWYIDGSPIDDYGTALTNLILMLFMLFAFRLACLCVHKNKVTLGFMVLMEREARVIRKKDWQQIATCLSESGVKRVRKLFLCISDITIWLGAILGFLWPLSYVLWMRNWGEGRDWKGESLGNPQTMGGYNHVNAVGAACYFLACVVYMLRTLWAPIYMSRAMVNHMVLRIRRRSRAIDFVELSLFLDGFGEMMEMLWSPTCAGGVWLYCIVTGMAINLRSVSYLAARFAEHPHIGRDFLVQYWFPEVCLLCSSVGATLFLSALASITSSCRDSASRSGDTVMAAASAKLREIRIMARDGKIKEEEYKELTMQHGKFMHCVRSSAMGTRIATVIVDYALVVRLVGVLPVVLSAICGSHSTAGYLHKRT